MKKSLKLYLDTSVWNFALETDRKFDYNLTNNFLNNLDSDKNSIIAISDLVLNEIDKAPLARRDGLLYLIEKYDPEILKITDGATYLSKLYVSEKLIPVKSTDDAVHIGVASDSKCDFIVSWNFKHIVRAQTIRGVHRINFNEGFGLIEIITPREYLGI